MRPKELSLLFFLSLLISCDTVRKKDFEGTWYIKDAQMRPGIQHAFIQFKNGKYNVFWIEGNALYYCPNRDGTYNHFNEVLFLKEDFVSYDIFHYSGEANKPDDMYLRLLSKRDSSNVRFHEVWLLKHSSDAIFDVQNLTVILPTTGGQQTQFPVAPTTNDAFLPDSVASPTFNNMPNSFNDIAL